jgi:lipid II:glycine glycyltransferase (peptidoglycan interpeptide bridge formation enzyme)
MSYRVEIDKINPDEWHRELTHFSDASIYQTWSYGEVRWGKNSLSHIVVFYNNEVVGLAQLAIKKIPFLSCGIAYVPWGPVWKRNDRTPDAKTLETLLSGLHQEYVRKRKLLLRLAPSQWDMDSNDIVGIYSASGFKHVTGVLPYRTLVLDIKPTIDDLRANLRANWRNHLRAAEKRPLNIVRGCDEKLFLTFMHIYDDMRKRKGFVSNIDLSDFLATQQSLPPSLKMKIMVCYVDKVPVAAVVCAVVGTSAIYILGATTADGLRSNGAYLLHWNMIKWLKILGVEFYDLGGIDPDNNHSVYDFKKGLAGKRGLDIKFIGQFEACDSVTSSFAVRAADSCKRLRHSLRRRRHNQVPEQAQ